MIGIFSNGFGETAVATKIANNLAQKNQRVVLFPLLGNVTPCPNVEVPFQPRNVGSGGMTFSSVSNFIRDLKHKAFKELLRYIITVRNYDSLRVVIVIGDPFLLFLVKSVVRGRPIVVFSSLYKSEAVEKHFWFEKAFIRKFVHYFVPRDRYTAECFKKLGVETVYFGNLMLDAVEFRGIDFRENPGIKTLLLLPGSRDSAYKVMPKFLSVVESIFEKFGFFNVLCPLSGGISMEKMEESVLKHGWEVVRCNTTFELKKGLVKVVCAYGAFGDMVRVSDVVLSYSGTATEQAAGFGKPTVMFFDKEVGWSRKWFERQKVLLGGNLKFFESFAVSEISDEIIMLFNDSKERKRRGEIGKKMVEGIGSVEKFSNFILSLSTY